MTFFKLVLIFFQSAMAKMQISTVIKLVAAMLNLGSVKFVEKRKSDYEPNSQYCVTIKKLF